MPHNSSCILETSQKATSAGLSSPCRRLVSSLGSFALEELHAAELTGIAAKLIEREDLTSAEMRHLIFSVSLPQLAKLASLVTSTAPKPEQRKTLSTILPAPRPRVVLAIASALEEGGAVYALRRAQTELQKLSQTVAFNHPVHIALDSWIGQFDLNDLLKILGKLRDSSRFSIRILGPSSQEVNELLRGPHSEKLLELSLPELFCCLKKAGICCIDGGTDYEIHLHAAQAGLEITVGQTVAPTAAQRLESVSGEQMQLVGLTIGQSYAFETFVKADRFLSDMLFVKSRLVPAADRLTWVPWLNDSLFAYPVRRQGALALHVLRCVSLARIFLPEVSFIRVPPSLITANLFELAVLCGANDGGYDPMGSL